MTNEHNHNHGTREITNINKAFIVGICLNLLFVIIEVVAGFRTNSLALFTDAGHNLTDVGSLLLSLFAFSLVKIKPNKSYTYGYKKTTILASLINAVILLVAVGAILWETISRFGKPVEIHGDTVAMVAFAGIVVNSVSAFLFFKDKEKDLNIKGAYLHLLADALVSMGVVIGGVVIYYTKFYWIDPVLSIIIAMVILYSTWGLLKNSLRLSLDGVPENVDIQKVTEEVSNVKNVKDFHHLHIWAISTTQNALTGHLVVANHLTNEEVTEIKGIIKHKLEHLNIQHTTLETEFEDEQCKEPNC
jgi:cobalt-zinc-cadmium efflux system protein